MVTNVQSNLWLSKLTVPDMVEKGLGSIIFTASVAALKPSEQLGTYGMSKLALIGLMRNLAQEFGPKGVRFNAICPGLIKTDFARKLWDNPKVEERIKLISNELKKNKLYENFEPIKAPDNGQVVIRVEKIIPATSRRYYFKK